MHKTGAYKWLLKVVSMGRIQQEQLVQQVAQRSMMPSMTDQLSYLRAQLAHRDAQLEQVRAERDNHFAQEEEVLAHMRLLSSEAKVWKFKGSDGNRRSAMSRKMLKPHNKLPKYKRPWINMTKLNGDRLKPTSKLYVNPTAPTCSLLHPSCMRQMSNTRSYILHMRDNYDSRHKPYEKLNSKNSKKRK